MPADAMATTPSLEGSGADGQRGGEMPDERGDDSVLSTFTALVLQMTAARINPP
ncbi:hypothetical protein AB0876_11375 [Mycobacterium sp. NPDC049093]